MSLHFCAFLVVTVISSTTNWAWQLTPAPDRRADEGVGPFEQMVINGCILIDGTGAPPRGPLNILVKKNKIERIFSGKSPEGVDHVLDATGMYLMPVR